MKARESIRDKGHTAKRVKSIKGEDKGKYQCNRYFIKANILLKQKCSYSSYKNQFFLSLMES